MDADAAAAAVSDMETTDLREICEKIGLGDDSSHDTFYKWPSVLCENDILPCRYIHILPAAAAKLTIISQQQESARTSHTDTNL